MKTFEKPMLKRHELNKKEKITASSTWNDGAMTAQWYFHAYVDGKYVDGSLGCFDLLDAHFATNTYADLLTNYNTWANWTAHLTRYNSTIAPDTSEAALNDYNYYKKCAKYH